MIVVAQRCSSASVSVDGAVVSKIDLGLLLLVGIEKGDGQSDIQKVVNKISNLRIFEDENNKMNLSICLLYTSPSPRDQRGSRMPASA